MNQMLTAEIGDYLYFIIFVVVMIIGAIDKMQKSKRQVLPPPVPQADEDDFGELEEQQQAPPQTIEELMRRMLQTQTVETQEPKTRYHEPEATMNIFNRNAEEKEDIKDDNYEFKFDIRQAIIANEILNRKY